MPTYLENNIERKNRIKYKDRSHFEKGALQVRPTSNHLNVDTVRVHIVINCTTWTITVHHQD